MDDLKIEVKRVGGLWHGMIEGFPDVDERGLTEEIARRKVMSVAERIARERRRPTAKR